MNEMMIVGILCTAVTAFRAVCRLVSAVADEIARAAKTRRRHRRMAERARRMGGFRA